MDIFNNLKKKCMPYKNFLARLGSFWLIYIPSLLLSFDREHRGFAVFKFKLLSSFPCCCGFKVTTRNITKT